MDNWNRSREESVRRSVYGLNGVCTIWFGYLGLAETFGARVLLFWSLE
jgi:hypothetical protein